MVSEFIFRQPDSTKPAANEGADAESRMLDVPAVSDTASQNSSRKSERTGGGYVDIAILRALFLKDAVERMSGANVHSALISSGVLANFKVGSLHSQLKHSAQAVAEIARTPDRDGAKADGLTIDRPPGMRKGKANRAHSDVLNSGTSGANRNEKDLNNLWRKAQSSVDQAVQNRGRETNAFKSMHDYLSCLLESSIPDSEMLKAIELAHGQISRIRDWDKPQWFRKEISNWRDPSGKRMTEYDFICARNSMTCDQMRLWDEWALIATLSFEMPSGSALKKVRCLDDYLVRRVSVDSVKNWMRRRPDEEFINTLFGALAKNKLYLTDGLRIRCLKDSQGDIRLVEMRDGKMYFEGTDEEAPVLIDERGCFVELPDDSDMVFFEKRTVRGQCQIVPLSQPNDRDPNIQWFGGGQVKRGWQKEQRFVKGPDSFSVEELYGFFPDHFPMRVTNSMENGKPTEKTGAAIYGYARDHAGRQARQLIAEYGEVMPGLKRNNSQLINDARGIFGLQKAPRAEVIEELVRPKTSA